MWCDRASVVAIYRRGRRRICSPAATDQLLPAVHWSADMGMLAGPRFAAAVRHAAAALTGRPVAAVRRIRSALRVAVVAVVPLAERPVRVENAALCMRQASGLSAALQTLPQTAFTTDRLRNVMPGQLKPALHYRGSRISATRAHGTCKVALEQLTPCMPRTFRALFAHALIVDGVVGPGDRLRRRLTAHIYLGCSSIHEQTVHTCTVSATSKSVAIQMREAAARTKADASDDGVTFFFFFFLGTSLNTSLSAPHETSQCAHHRRSAHRMARVSAARSSRREGRPPTRRAHSCKTMKLPMYVAVHDTVCGPVAVAALHMLGGHMLLARLLSSLLRLRLAGRRSGVEHHGNCAASDRARAGSHAQPPRAPLVSGV